MSKCGLVSHDVAASRLQRALNLFVGRGRDHTVAGVADAAMIKERTLRSYTEGSATPGFHMFLSLAKVLGPRWVNEILALIGMRAEMLSEADESASTVQISLAKAQLLIAEAMADGEIDHVERRTLPAMLRSLAEQLLAWAKQLEDEGT